MKIYNVVPGTLFPVPIPHGSPISILEKLRTWNVKRYQQHCTQGEGKAC